MDINLIIYYVRKVGAYFTTVTMPFLTRLAIDKTYYDRGGINAVGGEIFVPFMIMILAYYLYPKYDVMKKVSYDFEIIDENGKNHKITLSRYE